VCIVSLLADGRATRPFVGDIAEFKYYANLLSDVEIDSVKSELIDKYLSRASGGGSNLQRTARDLPPSIPPSSSSSSSPIAAVVGAVVGLVIVLCVSAIAWLQTSRRRARVLATRGNIDFQSPDEALGGGSKIVNLVAKIVRQAGLTMLNEEDFVAERTIGQGAHSVVYSARWRTSNTSVAIKVLQIFGVTSDEIANCARAVVAELAVLNTVRHPAVIPMYGVMVTSDEYTPGSVAVRIVMERAECSLQELLMETQSPPSMLSSPDSSSRSVGSSDSSDSHAVPLRIDLNLRNKLRIAASVASGLAHLHTARVSVVHRDLKPGNILIRRQGDGVSACIADFGVALLDKTTTTLVNPASYRPKGTLMYMVRGL